MIPVTMLQSLQTGSFAQATQATGVIRFWRFSPEQQYIDGPHLYLYAQNDPVSFSDPFGLSCKVFYKCGKVSEKKSLLLKHCEYLCVEDKGKPRRQVAGGTVMCDDPRIPEVTSHADSTFRWRCCKETLETAKVWEDRPYDPTKCSRAQCRKNADKAAKALKEACKLLPKDKQLACEMAADAAANLMALACDACEDP